MKNINLNKIVKTVAPAAVNTIVLVGKSAEKMKDEISKKLPNMKIVTINNEDEKRKGREDMKKKMLNNIIGISIPFVVGGIALLAGKIKESRKLDRINNELDQLSDEDVDGNILNHDNLNKISDNMIRNSENMCEILNNRTISGSAKNRKDATDAVRKHFATEMGAKIIHEINANVGELDPTLLGGVIERYLKDRDNDEFITYLVDLDNLDAAINIVRVFNIMMVNRCGFDGIIPIKTITITDKDMKIVKDKYIEKLYDKVTANITELLLHSQLKAIDETELGDTVRYIVDYNNPAAVLKLLEGKEVSIENQLQIVKNITRTISNS